MINEQALVLLETIAGDANALIDDIMAEPKKDWSQTAQPNFLENILRNIQTLKAGMN
tara:strand:- start:527 stop:697 length:171 start_codon:yes stop_codon:yes gene_type:complete